MQEIHTTSHSVLADKQAIRELIDRWIISSDAGLWDEFLATWHDDGFMAATWFQASAQEFAARRRAGFEAGVSIIHRNLAHMSDITGDRAIAQTKMIISQRAEVHSVLVDVNCIGRFYDFLERRDGRWGMVRVSAKASSNSLRNFSGPNRLATNLMRALLRLRRLE